MIFVISVSWLHLYGCLEDSPFRATIDEVLAHLEIAKHLLNTWNFYTIVGLANGWEMRGAGYGWVFNQLETSPRYGEYMCAKPPEDIDGFCNTLIDCEDGLMCNFDNMINGFCENCPNSATDDDCIAQGFITEAGTNECIKQCVKGKRKLLYFHYSPNQRKI